MSLVVIAALVLVMKLNLHGIKGIWAVILVRIKSQ